MRTLNKPLENIIKNEKKPLKIKKKIRLRKIKKILMKINLVITF